MIAPGSSGPPWGAPRASLGEDGEWPGALIQFVANAFRFVEPGSVESVRVRPPCTAPAPLHSRARAAPHPGSLQVWGGGCASQTVAGS